MGPVDVVVAAAAGSAGVCGGGGLNSDSLKKRERKLLQNSYCLLKQEAWLLTAGRKSFLAIKEASQFRFTFIIQRSFKKASYFN